MRVRRPPFFLACLSLAACSEAAGDTDPTPELTGPGAATTTSPPSLPPDMAMPVDPGNMPGTGLPTSSPGVEMSASGEGGAVMAPPSTAPDEAPEDPPPDVEAAAIPTQSGVDGNEGPLGVTSPVEPVGTTPPPDEPSMDAPVDEELPELGEENPTLPDDEPPVAADPEEAPDVPMEDIFDGHCVVQPLTAEFRQAYDNLDPFYQKYADADGLPIISSLEPADEALERACQLVIDMVSARPDVRQALIDNHIRFAIIGESELTNDIPEYSYLADSINQRARGLGGTPAASCAEESILCNTELDRWRGEGICIHEFAHTIATAGLFVADRTFEGRLRQAFNDARDAGLFANTYAMENFQEYWAEGVQDWYYTNLESDPPNGVHNWVDRREELEEYDPTLYGLIAEFLPDEPQFIDCYSDE